MIGATLPPKPPIVVCIGDSITAGGALNDPSQSWPSRLGLITGWDVVNDGINSNTVTGPEYVGKPMDERIMYAMKLKPWAVVMLGGTNDVNLGRSAASIEQGIETVYQAAAKGGAKFVISTIPPEGSVSSVRDQVNSWIESKFKGKVVNFYAHLEVGGILPLDEQARGDGIHPNSSEEAWLARAVAEKLERQ